MAGVSTNGERFSRVEFLGYFFFLELSTLRFKTHFKIALRVSKIEKNSIFFQSFGMFLEVTALNKLSIVLEVLEMSD